MNACPTCQRPRMFHVRHNVLWCEGCGTLEFRFKERGGIRTVIMTVDPGTRNAQPCPRTH